MPCYKPIAGFRTPDGVVFSELARHDILGDIKLPCGQCLGCRLDRAREWSVRCLHEAKMHRENSFITLTYAEENLPVNNSLDYRDYQLFMKRLRKKAGPVRFFMCGEYGELLKRPHYHAILFGYQFPDLVYMGKSGAGYPVYRSPLLENLWPLGRSLVGAVSRQSAGYVARYCLKKVNGDRAEAHYNGRTPEFAHMSLKPGLGATFFQKWSGDILPNDYVIEDGYKIPVPKYYDKLFKGDIDDVKFEREKYARTRLDNNTPERLAVREVVQHERIKALNRGKVE
ncbi:MAG: replication initiator protein [Microvirus sp.]|nr:MAG: replication initiator protein [Microvirus sp.]